MMTLLAGMPVVCSICLTGPHHMFHRVFQRVQGDNRHLLPSCRQEPEPSHTGECLPTMTSTESAIPPARLDSVGVMSTIPTPASR